MGRGLVSPRGDRQGILLACYFSYRSLSSLWLPAKHSQNGLAGPFALVKLCVSHGRGPEWSLQVGDLSQAPRMSSHRPARGIPQGSGHASSVPPARGPLAAPASPRLSRRGREPHDLAGAHQLALGLPLSDLGISMLRLCSFPKRFGIGGSL